MFSIWHSSVDEVLQHIASTDPAPGSGFASVLTGLVGLNLVRMAVKISSNGAADAARNELAEAESDLSKIHTELRNDANADMAAFTAYLAAIRMPKGDPVSDQDRNFALDAAIHLTINVPLDATERIIRGLTIAQSRERLIKESVFSELLSGSEIMKGASTSLLYNIDANVKSPRMAAHRDRLAARRISLLHSVANISGAIAAAGRARGFA